MSDAQAALRPIDNAGLAVRPGPVWAIAVALASGVAMTWEHAGDVWRTGAFYDTDDAMRMVQVRDLMAGQSWFDMAAHRMDPPAGVFMHWSRIVDVPLVLLMKLFGLFAAPAQAEAMTRLAFPFLLLVALYFVVARVASQFGDRATQMAAIGLTFATGPAVSQFVAGRIDHHAPQIVLLLATTGALLAAFDPRHGRRAWLAGLFVALSLAISLENLPFFLVLCSAPVFAWIVRGDEQRAAMRSFSTGLGLSLGVAFVATVGPDRWSLVACDAYSVAHLAAGMAGAAAMFALSIVSPRLANARLRLVAAGVAGGFAVVVLRVTAPACLGDPFVGLDPLVRAIWLDHVGEAQKLFALVGTETTTAVTIGAPLALAALASLTATIAARGLLRARFALLTALIVTGFVMTFWAVRVYSSAAPLAAIGGAAAAVMLARRLPVSPVLRAATTAMFCLPFAPMAYALVLPADPPTTDSHSLSCLRPEVVGPLDALPAGVVLAPIDAGSHLLAFTHHSAIAAPYHRDNHGNRLSVDAFMATPEKAEEIVRRSHADYVVACSALKQMHIMAEAAPNGLAAALIAGRIPDWLEPVDAKAQPNAAFRVRPR